jgi:AcrR family transcriptional regulator
MPRSTRDRPAKAPLSLDAVVEAGLGVLRAEGIDAVSMRRVAAELDTGPASLYVYVENRQDLLNKMFDAVAGQVDISEPPDPERWREQLEQLAVNIRATMNRYPGIARVPLANVPTGPKTMRVADHTLGILRAGGVADASAAWFMDIVALFINASSFETSIYAEEGEDMQQAHLDRIEREFAELDPSEFPNFVALGAALTAGSNDERFAFGIRLMINGLLNTQPPELA